MVKDRAGERDLYSLYRHIKNTKDAHGKSLCCDDWVKNRSEFYKWYEKQTQKQEGLCIYCHLPADTNELYNKHFRRGRRGKNLEVDRKNGKGLYSPDNCVLACYPCNNAKSDVFTYDEFQRIGNTINKIKNPNRGERNIDRAEFKKQLGELGKDIISEGIAYFTVWQFLMVEDEEAAQALNRYRTFFLPARGALHQIFLMQFAKVFDHDPRVISFPNLLTIAQHNTHVLVPYAEENDLEKLFEEINKSEDLLSRLKRYRDQRLAHHDSITPAKWHLQFGEIKLLIEQTKTIYNTLSLYHDKSSFGFDFLASEAQGHTSKVIEIIIQDLRQAKKIIKELDTTQSK